EQGGHVGRAVPPDHRVLPSGAAGPPGRLVAPAAAPAVAPAVDSDPAAASAMSWRRTAPSQWMVRAASYADRRASATVGPRAVTPSTRPPAVTNGPSAVGRRVPAWNTVTPATGSASCPSGPSPTMGSPVRGSVG